MDAVLEMNGQLQSVLELKGIRKSFNLGQANQIEILHA